MEINLAFGGNGACGLPWSPQGPAVALRDCPQGERAGGAGDYLWNVFQTGVTGSPTVTHDPHGWPTFTGWPKWNVVLRQQVYYRWLERAWRAGLRVYVMQTVDNEGACHLNVYRIYRCGDTAGVLRQIRDMYALQDYVDAQSGGHGKGWFRIVTDPFQARRVINAGKLAVVLGIEASDLFGCGLRDDMPQCDRAQIDRGLDMMHRLGVRTIFVSHKFDNALAGVAMDKAVAGAVIGSLNYLETGRFWHVQTCTGAAHDEAQISLSANPLGPLIPSGVPGLLPAGRLPVYPPPPHCNTRGVSNLGEYFVLGLIKRHMIVEADHMSVRARHQVLTLLEAHHYSGVISSHSWSDLPSLPRILKLGGIITPIPGPVSSPFTDSATPPPACCFLDVWKWLRKTTGVGNGTLPIGFGDDMSGPQPAPPPRAAGMPTVTYPFRSFDGGTIVYRQQSGSKTYDINTDGVAHIGLFPDWWERLRLTAGQRVIDDLAASAEAYLQMWERAAGVPPAHCLASDATLDQRGLGPLALGITPEGLLMRAGQPQSRPLRAFRHCAPGGHAAVVFDTRERSSLIASTARSHGLRGIQPGDPASRIPHDQRVHAGGSGVYVRALSRRTRAVYVAHNGRVTAVAIAPTKLADNPAALRRSLHLAGVQ
jgi:hypothetical protein